MHASDLGDLDKLADKLVPEDIQREKSPALYGLEKSPEGVLLAAGTLAQRANAASAKGKRANTSSGAQAATSNSSSSSGASTSSPKAPRPSCTWCKANGRSGRGHIVANCFSKRVSDLEAAVRSGSAAGNAATSSGTSGTSPFPSSSFVKRMSILHGKAREEGGRMNRLAQAKSPYLLQHADNPVRLSLAITYR